MKRFSSLAAILAIGMILILSGIFATSLTKPESPLSDNTELSVNDHEQVFDVLILSVSRGTILQAIFPDYVPVSIYEGVADYARKAEKPPNIKANFQGLTNKLLISRRDCVQIRSTFVMRC